MCFGAAGGARLYWACDVEPRESGSSVGRGETPNIELGLEQVLGKFTRRLLWFSKDTSVVWNMPASAPGSYGKTLSHLTTSKLMLT